MSTEEYFEGERRSKKDDDIEDLDTLGEEYAAEGELEEDVILDENEEVNLDNPSFQKGEMWSDYAEDMDFEE